MEADVLSSHRGGAVDNRPTVTELLAEAENLQESLVFDCSLVDC